MATKPKEELLAEARELGLEFTEGVTVKEIKAAMAELEEESEPIEDEAPAVEAVLVGGAGAGREPVVGSEPEQTFEERTGGTNQPWLNEDGSQNVG